MYFYNLLLILVALLSVSAKCSVGAKSLCNTASLLLHADKGGFDISCVNTKYVAVCVKEGHCVQMSRIENTTWNLRKYDGNNCKDKADALLFKSNSGDAITQYERAQQNNKYACKTLFPNSQKDIIVCNK